MSICCPRACPASTLSLLAPGKALGIVGLFLGLGRGKCSVGVGCFSDSGRRLDVDIPLEEKVCSMGCKRA